MAMGVAGLAFGGGAEQGRDIVEAFDICLACEIEVTPIRLAFARESVFLILLGLCSFQCRH